MPNEFRPLDDKWVNASSEQQGFILDLFFSNLSEVKNGLKKVNRTAAAYTWKALGNVRKE